MHHMKHHPHTLIADFTTGNVNRQLVSFAMPMFLSHLLQIVYNMADMIIVGQTLGKVGLSAISVGVDTQDNRMEYEIIGHGHFGETWGIEKGIIMGVPMAIKNAAVQFSKMFVNSWVNSFGVAVSAFAGIANKINMSVNMMSNSVNTAGASMVGQNIGAAQYDRVRQIVFAVYRIMIAVAVAASLVIYFFPEQVYGIFTDDPAVIQIGYEYIPIAILAFFSCAGRSGSNALINGSGNSRVNFITAVFDGIVLRLGLSVLFGIVLDMKYMGFWLGDALANFTPLWVGLLFYHSGAWKKKVV